MTELDSKCTSLRVSLRKHGKNIADDVYKHLYNLEFKNKELICVFCYSTSNITKEHVIPKWLFQNDDKSTFVTGVNKQTQTYNKAVIPACSNCNNSILAHIEKGIIHIVPKHLPDKSYSDYDFSYIIRWMELIEYKTQVYDCTRRFIKFGDDKYDTDWGSFSIARMRHFYEMKPYKAYDLLRSSQRRITVKAKAARRNSLAIFNTKTPHFNFFSQPSQYIFISFPMYQLAFFYFFKKSFNKVEEAFDEAEDIMHRVFNS